MAWIKPTAGSDTHRHTATLCMATMVLSFVLASCSTVPRETATTQPVVTQVTTQPSIISQNTESAEIARLWSATENAILENRWKEADIFITEALNEAPNDPVLLSRAAEIKLVLDEPVVAEALASRSVAYAEDNRTLLHRNWLIIEHVRDVRGDLLGRREAHQMVMRYQRQ